MYCSDIFLFIGELTAKSRFSSRIDVEEILSGGGGLLIHPDRFARIDFRLFCLCYVLFSCSEIPHLQSRVQQVFSKKLLVSCTLTGRGSNYSGFRRLVRKLFRHFLEPRFWPTSELPTIHIEPCVSHDVFSGPQCMIWPRVIESNGGRALLRMIACSPRVSIVQS